MYKRGKCKSTNSHPGIQNAVSIAIAVSVVAIAVSVAIGKNRYNVKMVFHIAAKTQFGQLRTFSMWLFCRDSTTF